MNREVYYVGIDIGAGLGAKIGLFRKEFSPIGESLLATSDFGESAENLAHHLARKVRNLVDAHSVGMDEIRAIGVVSPGLFKSDGTYQLAHNLPYLNGHNLKELFEKTTGIRTGIENDANAGGLAEWSVLRTDVLYWVFGGGWGGAWIDRKGRVQHPSLDWDGKDESLHYTNEPGYAIPLEKHKLRTLFAEVGASFELFERNLLDELDPEDGLLRGPATANDPLGSADHLRAETILSGPGRCRLFRAIVHDDDFYERFLNIHEVEEMNDPAVAGKHISKLSSMRVESAVNTDRLFGKILAEATHLMQRQAEKDGCPKGIPICLGGKPSYALPYFGPSAQRALGKKGIMSYLRPSVLDERGHNANLVGAAVLAGQVADRF